MIEFVESPIYSNWLQKNIPCNKLVICSPFIKKNAISRLLDFYEPKSKLGEYELIILIRAQKNDFLRGSSDICAIEYLAELTQKYHGKVVVKIINNLHMKAYCVDDSKLLITSGNTTPRGLINSGTRGNVEAGLATDDECAIARFNNYFENILLSSVDLLEFMESQAYADLISTVPNEGRGETSKNEDDMCALFYVQPPEVLLEYPETEKEDAKYKRFELVDNLDRSDFTIELEKYIPQNADSENYFKTIRFLCENHGKDRTMERLAQYIGTSAIKTGSRDRKPSGVMTNLKLLGLVEDKRAKRGILPGVTDLGAEFYNSELNVQISILRDQSNNLPWMEHIRLLRAENPDETLIKILTEYLCNKPFEYAESSAKRYRPAMAYFCKLNGIE